MLIAFISSDCLNRGGPNQDGFLRQLLTVVKKRTTTASRQPASSFSLRRLATSRRGFVLIGAQRIARSSFESSGLPASSFLSSARIIRKIAVKSFHSRRISCAVSQSACGGFSCGQQS